MADPKRVVERHVEAFNARDADAEPWSENADFVAPNASMHGREQVLGFLAVFWEAFPDGRLEPSRILAEGSVVAAEGRFTGTHTGVMRTPAGDVAATGRDVDFRWMSSYEVRGDELASEHLYFRSGRPARPARTDAGDLSAFLPCARGRCLQYRLGGACSGRRPCFRTHTRCTECS
jgi:predicted ester cyclase